MPALPDTLEGGLEGENASVIVFRGLRWACRRGGPLGTPQQVEDLFVFNLGKALVKLADRMEIVRGMEANEPVHQRPQPSARGSGRYWDSHDKCCRLALAERVDGSDHACSRGDSVIHQNHGPTGDLQWRTVAPVEDGAPVLPLPHFFRDAFNLLRGDALCPHDLFIQVPLGAGRNRAEGEFLLPGNAKLVREKDVQRHLQGVCDLKGNGDAAAGYSEDDSILPIGKLLQLLRQLPSGVFTVSEDHRVRSGVSPTLPTLFLAYASTRVA
jgi:hypothetical protein